MELWHASIFTGIGGFDLAAEWAGFRNVLMSEIDPYCQALLRLRFPGVPLIGDVHDVNVDTIVSLWYNNLSINMREVYQMVANKKQYDQAVEMYNSGLSIQDVANYYQITRQAMWMILKRRGCQFRDHLKYKKDNHFYRGGVTANGRVHDITEIAIGRGVIVRQTHCSNCGVHEPPICAHHDDYNKPLEVRWLCKSCHFAWHQTNKVIELTIQLPAPMTQKEIARLGGKASHKAKKEVPDEELLAEVAKIDLLTAGVP